MRCQAMTPEHPVELQGREEMRDNNSSGVLVLLWYTVALVHLR